jgi:hypothetical protein
MDGGTADYGNINEDPEYSYNSAGEDEALPASGLERHSRRTVILKPRQAAAAYREMLFFYGIKTLMDYLEKNWGPGSSYEQAVAELDGGAAENRVKDWINLGGQIVPAFRVDALRKEIREGNIKSWEAIHAGYDTMAAAYDMDRARHAWAVLAHGQSTAHGTSAGLAETARKHACLAKPEDFKAALKKAVRISAWIKEQVYLSRAKDFLDPFRGITYRNKEEMEQVAGRAEDNPFVRLAEENHRRFTERADALKTKLCAPVDR